MGCCISTAGRRSTAAVGGEKKKRKKRRKPLTHDETKQDEQLDRESVDNVAADGAVGPLASHANNGGAHAPARTSNHAATTMVPSHQLPPRRASNQHLLHSPEQQPDTAIRNPLSMSVVQSNSGRRSSCVSDHPSRSDSLVPIDTASLSSVGASGGGGGGYAARGGGRVTNADLESTKSLLQQQQLQVDAAAAAQQHAALQLGDSTSTTTLSCSCNDEIDDGTDTAGLNDDEAMDVVRALPERQVEALPLMVLVAQAQAGLLSVSSAADIGSAFRTKMRFRDVEGWLAEVGQVPAAVRSLVHHSSNISGNSTGSTAGGGSGHDNTVKLTSRQLEQNQRLLLQLKARTTTQQPMMMMSAAQLSAPAGLQQHRSASPLCSPVLGAAPVVVHVGVGGASMAPPAVSGFNDELFPASSFEEELRKYSIASSSKKNRVPDRNVTGQDEVGVSDFYAELEDEERRLSTIKHSSSDEDY